MAELKNKLLSMLNNPLLKTYISKFQRLKQGNTAFGKAPHKPILLLAVIHQIEKGLITDNRLYLTPDLVTEFIETFPLVKNGNRYKFNSEFYYLFNLNYHW